MLSLRLLTFSLWIKHPCDFRLFCRPSIILIQMNHTKQYHEIDKMQAPIFTRVTNSAADKTADVPCEGTSFSYRLSRAVAVVGIKACTGQACDKEIPLSLISCLL